MPIECTMTFAESNGLCDNLPFAPSQEMVDNCNGEVINIPEIDTDSTLCCLRQHNYHCVELEPGRSSFFPMNVII